MKDSSFLYRVRKRLPFVSVLLAGLCILWISEGSGSMAFADQIRQITAYTEVTPWGQMPKLFQVRGQDLPDGPAAEDFRIDGTATGWGTSDTHPFSCGVHGVKRTEDGWNLVPELFPDKYFYVCSMTVSCPQYPELDFTLEEIGETVTETADLFVRRETDNHVIKAWIYQPEEAKNLPVVIVFHGYGDTSNLLTYRTAVDWAEPEHQRDRACIVIAPTIDDGLYISDGVRSKIFSQVLLWVDELAEEGLADPDRVYVMGNSFGGMSSIEIAEQFPDRIRAVMALCPALNYSRTALASLAKMKDVPLYIAHAEQDETIPVSVSRQAAEALTAAGGNVTLRIFTDEEMNAAGAAHGSENTYSFHHVELALLQTADYAEWLLAQ